MSESEAVVSRIEGDHVWLDMNGQSKCTNCEQAASCGLGDGLGKARQRVRNTIGARVGDTVGISVPDGALLKAAVYSYLVPLGLVLGGAVTGMTAGGDSFAVVGAVGGLVGGWLFLRYANRWIESVREPLLAIRIKGGVVHHLQRNRTL